jgi:hypothetical protein
VDVLAPPPLRSEKHQGAVWKKPWLRILRMPRQTATTQEPPAMAIQPRSDEEWRKIRARVLHDRPWCEVPDCFLPSTDIEPASAHSVHVVSVCGSHHPGSRPPARQGSH